MGTITITITTMGIIITATVLTGIGTEVARFLLVAGSCYGSWIWEELRAALTRFGHEAPAFDLPGHGADQTPRGGITLQDYAEAICAALDDPGMDAPSILVGHSMAGYPITAAAELDPSRIAALVYLCAYRPRAGQSLADMRRAGPSQPLRPAIRVRDGCFSFDPDQSRALFYHDCPEGTLERSLPLVTPEPILPQETPLTLTARSAALPQFHIRCDEDRAIPPVWQSAMAEGIPDARRFALPSSHSPFFSMPDRLAALLDRIAADCGEGP